jgi:hypothetical protein
MPGRNLFQKHALLPWLVFAVVFLCWCTKQEWPVSPFERIEKNRIRPVGMVIDPYPEGAPGDTLRVSAYFAGKPIAGVADFRVCKGEWDTIGAPIATDGLDLWLPDSIRFSYVLPDSMLDSVFHHLPIGNSQGADLVDLFLELRNGRYPDSSYLDSSRIGFLTGLNLFCRFMFTVMAADGERLAIRKDFVVRYNRRLQEIRDLSLVLPVNRNPALRFVALYKVRGDVYWFDPNDQWQGYDASYLQTKIPGAIANDTIVIDTGYSYFLGTDTGIVGYWGIDGKNNFDTCIDQAAIVYPLRGDSIQIRDIIKERFSYEWFYEAHGGSSPSPDDRMALQERNPAIARLFPPLDPGVYGCTIWVKIVDHLYSLVRQPNGSARTCVQCAFRYTEAYRRAMGH